MLVGILFLVGAAVYFGFVFFLGKSIKHCSRNDGILKPDAVRFLKDGKGFVSSDEF